MTIRSEDETSFRVDFASGETIDINELRRRGTLSANGGPHVWVIQAIYHLEDPEVAMDKMELAADNFVGVSDIHCLCCGVAHRTASGPNCVRLHPEGVADVVGA